MEGGRHVQNHHPCHTSHLRALDTLTDFTRDEHRYKSNELLYLIHYLFPLYQDGERKTIIVWAM